MSFVKTDQSQLTAAEMGKLWATYVGNTMGKCVLSYYLQHVNDKEIKGILQFALGLCEDYTQDIEAIFKKAAFPIPVGFTKDDVNLEAPRLYEDDFYLHYLQYLGKAGMSIYSVAIPLVTRKDIRDFFVKTLHDTSQLMVQVNDVLLSKNASINPPVIPPPEGVDFITKQSFLNVFFGNGRPLQGLEIAHLYGNMNNDITSKAIITGFVQVAKNEKVRQYLERGKNLNEKHIDLMSDKLSKDGLPSPSLIDHLVRPSTESPFSDKLMVYHKIDMFAMKIREYANGASLSARKDVAALFAKCQLEVSLYVEDGANIMIDHGWLEQPPEAIDRDELQAGH
ncbi:DUF3231 family protein [Paenibacillus cellulositrophicus]|uniref:DUF3231 family protein n=1 Tax=Paenibacillus cellulositrophicus TaxID=562959 RepID=UPI003F7EEF71